jgi:hypothetical protein
MPHNSSLRYLLVFLICVSAVFIAAALYTISTIFTVARFNEVERRGGSAAINAIKNLSSHDPALFLETVRRVRDADISRSFAAGKAAYADFIKELNEKLLPDNNINIFLWLDEDGIPLFTGYREGENPPTFKLLNDAVFFEVLSYKALMGAGDVSGFAAAEGKAMLAAAVSIPSGSAEQAAGRVIALTALPADLKKPAENALETELFFTDDPLVIADWARLAGAGDGLVSVVDRDTLQISVIFKDLNGKPLFALYGFSPRGTGQAAIETLIFSAAAFFFAILIFIVLTSAVIYRIVQLPLEHFAAAAEKLAKEGVPIGGGFRGILSELAAKVNILGRDYRKISKISAQEAAEGVNSAEAAFDLNKLLSKIVRKNTAFAEKNEILLYMDYEAFLPALFYGRADKTEEAADLLTTLVLQATAGEEASKKCVLVTVETGDDKTLITLKTTAFPQQLEKALREAVRPLIEELSGELIIEGTAFTLILPLKAAESPQSPIESKGIKVLVVSKTIFREILKRKLEAFGAKSAVFSECAEAERALMGAEFVFIEAEDSADIADFIKNLKNLEEPPKSVLMKRGALPAALKNLTPVVYSVNAANSEIRKIIGRE